MMTHVGKRDGLHYSLGYAGHGVAMATILGRTVAEAMLAGDIQQHPFAQFKFPGAPLGLYNGFDEPQVVAEGNSSNTIAHGWSPIASHCIEVELKPGESKELVFVLGYVENAENEKWESKNIINKT
ncbi:MAG: hypothetical protein HGA28_06540, partial [Anaerolineaceae bacterium]|nr:hypothetical protein [Anaerolineaceae bacterium]